MSVATASRLSLRLRKMVPRDMHAVMEIEQTSFEVPWSYQDFLLMREVEEIRMVVATRAEDDKILGYLVYAEMLRVLRVENMAVHSLWRKFGVGTLLMSHLATRLSRAGRSAIVTEVRERNVVAQCFLRDIGFNYAGTLPNHFPAKKGWEDAYSFRFELRDSCDVRLVNDDGECLGRG